MNHPGAATAPFGWGRRTGSDPGSSWPGEDFLFTALLLLHLGEGAQSLRGQRLEARQQLKARVRCAEGSGMGSKAAEGRVGVLTVTRTNTQDAPPPR